jgi:hypothetical protein
VSDAGQASQSGSRAKWMYARGETQSGPCTSKDLQDLATKGELLPTDLIWKDGMKNWMRADRSSLVFPESIADAMLTDSAGQGNHDAATVISVDETTSPKPPEPQASASGLPEPVQAPREECDEATQTEAQEHHGGEEVLIEDLSWFQKSLAEIITSDEVVRIQLEGLDVSGLVCTDRRVIICHTGHFTWMLGNVKTFQATYDEITTVSLIEERLRIQPLLGGGYVFELVTPNAKAGATAAGSFWEFAAEPNRLAFGKDKLLKLQKAETFIRERMQAVPPKPVHVQAPSVPTTSEPSPSPNSVPDSNDVVAKLKSLAELKVQGLVTDEEFSQLKQRLLDQL